MRFALGTTGGSFAKPWRSLMAGCVMAAALAAGVVQAAPIPLEGRQVDMTAREQPIAGISGATIAERVSVPVSYVPDFSAVARTVGEVARPGDVIVTMGAGDVTMLGSEILTELQVRSSPRRPGRPGANW